MLNVPRIGPSNFHHDAKKHGISADVSDVWRDKLPAADIWICEKLVGRNMEKMNYEKINRAVPLLGILKWLLLYPMHVLGVFVMNPGIAARVFRVTKLD